MTTKVVLSLILILFLFTRFFQLGTIPASVYWDEASIGYNAYSILKTGHDEWGVAWPIHFKAFGEYKLPVYIYSTIPFIYLGGLNEWTIRMPAVLFSLGIVILIYLISKRLTNSDKVGLWSAFLITIYPWLFILGRAGYEATAGLFFYLLGILFLLKTIKQKNFFYGVSLAWVLSLYSYNSFRIIIPLTLIIFLITAIVFYRKIVLKQWLTIMLSGLLLVVLIIPIGNMYLQGQGAGRINSIGIFSKSSSPLKVGYIFLANYFSHFNPDFLFVHGDQNKRSHFGIIGETYFIDAVFLLIGLIYLIRKKAKGLFLVFILLLISPVPASLATESPHALRSLTMVPFFAILVAYGITAISQRVKFVTALIGVLYLVFFGYFYYQFLTNYNSYSSESWQYGYKVVFSNYQTKFKDYDHIIISDEYNHPYIFGLFYLSYDPSTYQKEVIYNQTIRKATSLVRGFGPFDFTKINFYDLPSGRNLLFAHPNEKLSEISPIDTIKNVDGSTAFYVYEYQTP